MPQNQTLFKGLQDRPWALHPAKFEEIAAFLDRRLAGEKLAFPEAAAGPQGNKADGSYDIVDGTAIIPVYGVIDKRMNMLMKYSGGTSTELLARDFQKAMNDPQVQAILLDVDSPGGSVDGPKDLADLIYQARGQGKPVVAFANGLMASAAYWIGSAADAVVGNDTAEVGSIGVAAMHYDFSLADEQAGVKRTAIFAGKYKRIASDEKPLSEEGRDYLQGIVDDYYGLFVEAVARNRGADVETVQNKMADGRIFIGKKALKAGLIDKIGNFNDALALAGQMKEGDMPKTKEQLQAENPELYQEIRAEGAAGVTLDDLLAGNPQAAEKFRAEGRDAERNRTVKILTKAGLKGLTLTVIQKGDAYETALEKFWDNREKVKAEVLAAMQEEAPPVVGTSPAAVERYTESGGSLTAGDLAMCQQLGISQEQYLASKKELAKRGE